MQIDRVLFPITTLGPGKRIGIWTIGCPHHCFKCSNPELWEVDESRDVKISDIISGILPFMKQTNGITITGGDPFFQPEELYILLKSLKQMNISDILVYTGYKYESLKKKYPHILLLIDVLIDEPYVDMLNNNLGILGSTNQNMIVLNTSLKYKYEKYRTIERTRQNFVFNDKIISVGIPTKTY